MYPAIKCLLRVRVSEYIALDEKRWMLDNIRRRGIKRLDYEDSKDITLGFKLQKSVIPYGVVPKRIAKEYVAK